VERRATSVTATRGSRIQDQRSTARTAGQYHIEAERQQEHGNDAPKYALRNATEDARAERGADHHAQRHDDERRPGRNDLATLRGEINRETRAVDEERDRGGGGDEGRARHVEAEHRRGTDAALVSHQPAESARKCAGDPRRAPSPMDALNPARKLGGSGEKQQRAEDDSEPSVRDSRVKERAGESSGSTRDAETEQHSPVHVRSQQPETLQ